MLAEVNEVCPAKIKRVKEIGFSIRTCVRRTEELENILFSQLKYKYHNVIRLFFDGFRREYRTQFNF